MILQFADTFASNGNPVLFFSLEQTEYDLTVKSLNRIRHLNKCDESQALDEFLKFSDNITTVVSNGKVTDELISNTVDDYITKFNRIPIVFIDYLQLISANGVSSKKDIVERVSTSLVNISKKHHLTMFVLSSLNRANYNSQIDFESFKESGSLEYDADVVLGLQYQVIGEESFIGNSSVDRKRVMLSNAKTSDIRKVELVCLKNRFGKIAPKCKLDYCPAKDLFVVSPEKPNKSRVHI